MVDLTPVFLSVRIASIATLAIVPPGVAMAWWLSHGRPFFGKSAIETFLSLPLVLPPTVVGFYLLLAFGRGSAMGRVINDSLRIHLLFTWQGAAVAAAVMAFPLFVKTAATAFAMIDDVLLEAGRSLGATESHLLWHVILPISYRGLLSATALAMARSVGEFGATMVVAGSIPGETQTAALALFNAVEEGRNGDALVYTLILSITAFAILGGTRYWEARVASVRGGQ